MYGETFYGRHTVRSVNKINTIVESRLLRQGKKKKKQKKKQQTNETKTKQNKKKSDACYFRRVTMVAVYNI